MRTGSVIYASSAIKVRNFSTS